MSGITSKVTAFAIIGLSLGFAAMDAAPALAHTARTPLSPRTIVQRQIIDWRSGQISQFAPRADAASCALPSDGCYDNERITN